VDEKTIKAARRAKVMITTDESNEILKRMLKRHDTWNNKLFSPAGLAMLVPSNKRK
jgi:hypothetical protein